jgi:hypothetical protein
MKVEMSFLERGYVANLLRIRARDQKKIASDRNASSTRQELEQEAEWCEAKAQSLDNATEDKILSEKEPIRLDENSKRDINYIDSPPSKA